MGEDTSERSLLKWTDTVCDGSSHLHTQVTKTHTHDDWKKKRKKSVTVIILFDSSVSQIATTSKTANNLIYMC